MYILGTSSISGLNRGDDFGLQVHEQLERKAKPLLIKDSAKKLVFSDWLKESRKRVLGSSFGRTGNEEEGKPPDWPMEFKKRVLGSGPGKKGPWIL